MRVPRKLTVVVLLACSWSPLAWAEPDAKDAARALATSGIELFHEGRPAEAYERIQEAEALYPAITHRVYLARCLVALGRLVEAAALYQRIVGEPRAPDAPASTAEAHATAASELEALEPRLPRVVVTLSGTRDALEVTLDGERLAPEALGTPIAVDPGEHRVVARAPGSALRVEERFMAVERQTAQVALTLPEPVDPEEPEGSLVPAFVAFGVGALGLGVGAITGGISLGMVADIQERCVDNHCPREDEEAGERAGQLGTASTVSFVIGGAAVATGIVLAILRPWGGDPPASSHVTPLVGPGYVGVRGRF